jgi:hypothetical protein
MEPNGISQTSGVSKALLAPNPCRAGDSLSWGEETDWALYSITGELLSRGSGLFFSWNDPGLYVIQTSQGLSQRLVITK